MKRRSLIIAAAALPLAACTTFTELGGREREAIEGRFSIQVTEGSRRRTESGSFRLTAKDRGEQLDVGHPVAGTLARVTVTPAESVLEASGGLRVSGATPEELMLSQLGFVFPVREFRGWVSRPGADSFEEDGWKVSVIERSEERLPKLIRISREADAAAPAVRLTVFIDKRMRNAL